MIELSILKAFADSKETYQKYHRYVNLSYIKTNFKELHKLFSLLNIAYNKHTYGDSQRLVYTSLSRTELEALYLANYPVIKDTDRRELGGLLDRIFAQQVEPRLLQDTLESHRVRSLAGQLAVTALEANEGKKGALEALQKLIETFRDTSEGVDSLPLVSDDLEALLHETVDTPGIPFHLPCLRESLGPLRKGNFGVVFARPEIGKTTWLAQFVTHAVQYVDKPIIWLNNEQAGNEVKLRLYQALFGVPLSELMANRARYHALYKEKTKGLLFLYDCDTILRSEVEALCEQHSPSLIVIDQLDKIAGGKEEDRRDLTLGNTYIWARGLAKRYCPVVGVSQASDAGEGIKYLTYSHLADSRTAKPAEADFILGIGASHTDDFSLYRYFNISKNKLLGDANTRAEIRHGQFQVILEPEIARFREL